MIYGGAKLEKEEREKYIDLCNKLTSKDRSLNYQAITDELLTYIQDYLLVPFITEKENASTVETDPQKKELINKQIQDFKSKVQLISRGIDKVDTNYIGKLNIISLQFVILFTTICWPDSNKVFESNLNDVHNIYKFILSTNWTNYDALKVTLNDNRSKIFKKIYYIDDNTFLITILDYLRLDEIINTYLDNIFICGVSTDMIYADGRYLTPFEFLEHDIIHSNNYKWACFQRVNLDVENLKGFLHFVNTNPDFNKETKYSIKTMVFLLIHELFCDFFRQNLNEKYLYDEIASHLHRFKDIRDLGELIPKSHRQTPENPDSIEKYLKICVKIYIDALNMFFSLPKETKPSSEKGGKSKRKRNSKRSQNRKKKRKTRKGRK